MRPTEIIFEVTEAAEGGPTPGRCGVHLHLPLAQGLPD